MGFYTEELESLNLDELKQQFDRDGNYDDYYEEVAEQIVARGELGLVYLRRIVEEARIDEPQLCATIWVLSLQPEGPWYRERLQTLLQDPRGRVVRYALESLARIGARDLSETVSHLQTHPSPYARAGVLRYMSRLFPNEAPPLLIAALKDAHPIVQESAIDELDDLGYYQALPAIRPFLYDQPDPVRQAARAAVKNLTVLRKDAARTSPEADGEGKSKPL